MGLEDSTATYQSFNLKLDKAVTVGCIGLTGSTVRITIPSLKSLDRWLALLVLRQSEDLESLKSCDFRLSQTLTSLATP